MILFYSLINGETNKMSMIDSKNIYSARIFIRNLTKKCWVKTADFHLKIQQIYDGPTSHKSLAAFI